MPTLQGHVSYTFRPQLWLALDSTYYFDGETSANGVPAHDRKDNSRVGLTLSVPAAKGQSIKISYSRGATARLGSNFDTYGLAWQYSWFAKP
jgi:hypothetical protein